MSALYEKTQLTKVMISSAPVTTETLGKAEFLGLSCSIKEVQFTAGQKQDIDVTTLCSTEQENINGLGAASEISMSGNFWLNQAQNALRDAYDNDTTYGFKVEFPSGKGFMFLAEVRQHTWSVSTNSVVSATFSLRLKGKPSQYVVPLAFTLDLESTKSVAAGELITLSVAVQGGTAPYVYSWAKDGTVMTGETDSTLNIAGACADNCGTYTCTVTDAAIPAASIISTGCVVTVTTTSTIADDTTDTTDTTE